MTPTMLVIYSIAVVTSSWFVCDVKAKHFKYGVYYKKHSFENENSYSQNNPLVAAPFEKKLTFHNYPLPAKKEHLRTLLEKGKRFCEQRSQTCCPGRNDQCHVPILDTLCYCDEFCNRTVSDCCPDFWGHCLGVKPPDGAMTLPPQVKPTPAYILNNCKYDEISYEPGDTIKVNCNNCTCVKVDLHPEFNWKCSQKICIVRKELLEHVGKGNYGWKATNYTMFWGMTLADGVKFKLGTTRPTQPVKRMTSLHVHVNDILPLEFDARKQWPGLIHDVMDQGNCAASWAFSTASVASDRLSLHSGGTIKATLSPQNILSCNKDHFQKGCEGGHLDRAWWYLRRVGVVSDDCYPYVSGVTGTTSPCHYPSSKSLGSKAKCPHAKVDSSLVYQASPPYRIAPGEREIMKEIEDNGPVQATMEVKEDFFMYKGGVYRYSLPADYLPPNYRITGFHSVKIIGWGTNYSAGRPLKYWLCANSWGTKWGEDGYFRILRGVNECKIESFVVGVWGRVNGRQIASNNKLKNNHKKFRHE